MRRNLLTAAGLCSLSALAGAQNFKYPDFSSTAGLVLNGNATTSGTALRLTGTALSEKGSAWYDTAVPVDAGFDTTFTFQITQQAGGGGDGIAFVIQNDPDGTAALGDHAAAIGYGAFASSPTTNAVGNSLVLEIDTYGSGVWGDPDGNHLSLHTNGSADNTQDEAVSIGLVSPATILSDGQPHTVRLRYIPGQLDLYLDNLTTPVITIPYDIVNGGTWTAGGTVGGVGLMGGSTAYVGFTAGNGAAVENHDILSWEWASGPAVGTFCTSKPASLPSCTPTLTGPSSSLSKSAGSGSYDVTAAPVPGGGGKPGILIYTKNGLLGTPASTPFGFLCLNQFLRAGAYPELPGGTSSTCNGAYTWDFGDIANTLLTISPGDTLHIQGWYRDAQSPGTANFTQGIGPISVTP